MTCRLESSGARRSLTEKRPCRTAPRTNDSVTRQKKTPARARFPRYQCPAPGIAQASVQARAKRLRPPPAGSSEPTTSRLPTLFLFHDLDADVGRDVLVQLDGDRVRPQGPDGLMDLDAALVVLEAFSRQKVRDVLTRHGAEQRVALADLLGNGERVARDGVGHLLMIVEDPRVPGVLRALLVLDDLQVAGRGRVGELLRDQVVAAVAVGDSHRLAALAELLDVLSQYDVHETLNPW